MDIPGDAVFGIGVIVFKEPETVFDQIVEILYIFLSAAGIFAPVELVGYAGIVNLVDPVVPHLESAASAVNFHGVAVAHIHNGTHG